MTHGRTTNRTRAILLSLAMLAAALPALGSPVAAKCDNFGILVAVNYECGDDYIQKCEQTTGAGAGAGAGGTGENDAGASATAGPSCNNGPSTPRTERHH